MSSKDDPVECSDCEQSHYLDTVKSCLELSSVANCAQFSKTSDECTQCLDQHKLADGACVKIPNFEFCSDYQGTGSSIECVACSEESYLANGRCYMRSYSLKMIPNCSVLANDKDECGTCIPDFDLSSDRLDCLPLVKDCKRHVLVQGVTEFYQCSECLSPLLLAPNANSCFVHLEGCSEYLTSFKKCAICENDDYFLEVDGTCTKRGASLENCAEYSPNSNTCKSCEDSFRLTDDSLKCLSSIEFCNVKTLFNASPTMHPTPIFNFSPAKIATRTIKASKTANSVLQLSSIVLRILERTQSPSAVNVRQPTSPICLVKSVI